jgi:hypothetical protein
MLCLRRVHPWIVTLSGVKIQGTRIVPVSCIKPKISPIFAPVKIKALAAA